VDMKKTLSTISSDIGKTVAMSLVKDAKEELVSEADESEAEKLGGGTKGRHKASKGHKKGRKGRGKGATLQADIRGVVQGSLGAAIGKSDGLDEALTSVGNAVGNVVEKKIQAALANATQGGGKTKKEKKGATLSSLDIDSIVRGILGSVLGIDNAKASKDDKEEKPKKEKKAKKLSK